MVSEQLSLHDELRNTLWYREPSSLIPPLPNWEKLAWVTNIDTINAHVRQGKLQRIFGLRTGIPSPVRHSLHIQEDFQRSVHNGSKCLHMTSVDQKNMLHKLIILL